MKIKTSVIILGFMMCCSEYGMAQIPECADSAQTLASSENSADTVSENVDNLSSDNAETLASFENSADTVSENVENLSSENSETLASSENPDNGNNEIESDSTKHIQTAIDKNSEFIDSCRWIQTNPQNYPHDWIVNCENIYQFCHPSGENVETHDETSWSQTVYGQLLCGDLIQKCLSVGVTFEQTDDVKDQSEMSLSQTVETWADRICDTWSHCIGRGNSSIDERSDLPVYAADGLSALGFDTRIKDGKIQIRGNRQVLASAIIQDKILAKLQTFYELIRCHSHVATNNILSSELNQFFESGNDEIRAFEKMAVWATILPDLIHHAADSGAITDIRKLQSSLSSLNHHWGNMHYDIVCVRQRHHENLEMQFPASVLLSESYTDVTVHRDLLCPAREELYLDQGVSSEDIVYCKSLLVRNEPHNPVETFNQILQDVHVALINKDNDSISESMGRLVDGLNVLYNRYGYVASWNDYWEHAPIETWLCQIQTIELMALELQRMAELVRLERTLQQVFGKTTFYSRLQKYSGCRHQMPGRFSNSAERLWSDHHNDYDWIMRHYAPKQIKKLESDLNTWTKRVSKNLILERRLLASWTSWSNGNEKEAARFAFDVTDNRAILIHPQLNSYHRLLDIILNGTPNQQTLEQYVRVMLLKSPALAYQMLTEAGNWLNREGRMLVVNTVRQYPASLSPSEAARFYVMYTPEFRKILDLKQQTALNGWIERERSMYESGQQRLKRRVQWMEDLISLEDWQEIVRMFSYILMTDDSLSDRMRSHFVEISSYAQMLANSQSEPEKFGTSWKIEPDSDYDACIQSEMGDQVGLQKARKYLETAKNCLKSGKFH